MQRIRVRKYELALRFKNGDFVDVLRPGVYYGLGRFLRGERIEVVDTRKTRFSHRQLDVLANEPALADDLEFVDLVDDERAFVWKQGRLEEILGPGLHAFWKEPFPLEIEVHRVGPGPFVHDRMDAILSHADASGHFQAVRAGVHEHVVFYRDRERLDEMTTGVRVFWRLSGAVNWKSVQTREQVADVTGQEIMTADKVSLRINMLVTFRIADPIVALETVEDPVQTLYREAQLALRAAVGTRTLDQLLSEKDAVSDEVRAAAAARAESFGVSVKSVGLRDVILPGEMKTILNQVIEAEKRAEANLIQRREETAAARSQANTARLLTSNPALMRMKELEALQDILRGTRATFHFASGDLVDQVRSLAEEASDPES
ncbi:MAG: slipin family protein [Planctomycetota bacterium]